MNHSLVPRAAAGLPFHTRTALILGILVLANIFAWAAALRMAGSYPALLGTAMLAYGLGLRHAFDADHIATIDNVTRRLVAAGARPAGVGFFFALGHSSVVVAASIGVAMAASRFRTGLAHFQTLLGPFGVVFSSVFLLGVAALNLIVFLGIWRAVRRPRSTGGETAAPAAGGLMSRVMDRLAGRVRHSGLMFPLGLLLALGFDTATEIGLLGLTAAEAAKGLPVWAILVFPALFAAGMALADTLEGLLMLGVYLWTGSRPDARSYYNVVATGASIVAAAAIALGQLASLVPAAAAVPPLGVAASVLQRHSEWVGLAIVALFAALWGGWALADYARTASVAKPLRQIGGSA